jgi:PIN domain nuclease of toxin-antitoxin system
MILLDTHVLVWVVTADTDRLSRAVMDEIDDAVVAGEAAVSAATFWELAVKRRKTLAGLPPLPPVKGLRATVLDSGLVEVPVSGDLWVDAVGLLDEDFHADPADQLIVATAIRHRWKLHTMDRRIGDWAHRTNRVEVARTTAP